MIPKILRRYLAVATAFLIFSITLGGAETTPSGIRVELGSQNPLTLRVTLRSKAETRITFYKYLLPWGNVNSMMLIAVTPSGQYIDRFFPIDDPSLEQVAFEPKQSMSGEVKLGNYFRGLEVALKKSDIHLFWTYKAPDELNIAQWSGGWVLIPKQK
jgi:hypothetical protein